MEAKCDGCGDYFKPSELKVFRDGRLWCFGDKPDCNPPVADPILIIHQFTWRELQGVVRYIEGSRDLVVLEIIEDFKRDLDWETYQLLKRVLRHDDIQESDS